MAGFFQSVKSVLTAVIKAGDYRDAL